MEASRSLEEEEVVGGVGGTSEGNRFVVFGNLFLPSSITSLLSSVDSFLFHDNVVF